MIKLINYKVGNLNSIGNMLRKIDVDYRIINDIRDLDYDDKIILPGVGSFDTAIKNLKETGFFDEIKNNIYRKNYKLLGICLGMQILCNSSEEGVEKGLGLFDTVCKKFQSKKNNLETLIGWMSIKKIKKNLLLENLETNNRYYFLHSYYVENNKDFTIATSLKDDFIYSSIIFKKNIYGVQFHPERSHKYGMKILKNFSNL